MRKDGSVQFKIDQMVKRRAWSDMERKKKYMK